MKKFFTLFAIALVGLCAFAEVNAEYGPCPSKMNFALLNADDPSLVEIELQLVNSSLNLNGFNLNIEKDAEVEWRKVNRKNFTAAGYANIILQLLPDATDEDREELLLEFCDVQSNVNSQGKLVIIEILKSNECFFFPVLNTPTGIGKFYLDMSACEDGIYELRADNTPSGCSFSYIQGPEPVNSWTADDPVVIKLKKVGNKITELLGDANSDGLITIADYVSTASFILERDPHPFDFAAADIDKNNTIDINDLVGIGYMVLYDESDMLSTPSVEMPDAAHIALDASVKENNGYYEISVNMNNNIALTAMQMDLALPEGMTLIDASLGNRTTASHQLDYNLLKNGNYRLLVSSPAIKSFIGNEGTMLTLTVAGEPIGQSHLTGIQFVAPNLSSYDIDDVELNFNTTAIDNIYSNTRIYRDGGNVVIISPTNGKAQFVLPSGVSTTVEVVKGQNVYSAPSSGIVIVKMGDIIKKIITK